MNARVFRVFKLVGARERWALLEAVLRRAAPMLAPLLLFVAFEVRACHLSLSLGDEA